METNKLYSKALLIAQFVVIYNIIEGIISMFLGYENESLTLFGFGVDSFIEVASNLGVVFMIRRIQQNPHWRSFATSAYLACKNN
jgi:divalent metal cation (Fe/Co/Zn/Cd) transporter